MRSRFFVFAAAALLTACQTYQGNESSPFYVVPAGSHVLLNKDLTIPADRVGVYLQNGKVMRNVDLQHYNAFCKFELYHLSNAERTVAPDDFMITKAWQQEIQGALAKAAAPMYARFSLIRRADMSGDSPGGPVITSFSTFMALRSEKQPDAYRLTCTQWGYPGLTTHVTVADIRRALEPTFTLRLPNPRG